MVQRQCIEVSADLLKEIALSTNKLPNLLFGTPTTLSVSEISYSV